MAAILHARRYASAGISRRRVTVYLCVCLFVCLIHAGIVSKWLNIRSRKQCRVIAQGL